MGSTQHVIAVDPDACCSQAPLTRRASAAYAAGSFGTGVFSTVPTVILLYFCTEILALPAAWATVIVFVPKIWSMLWDPWVGAWSDRTITRIGRRRPFMIVGTLGMPFAFVAMFSPPPFDTLVTAVWVGITYFLLATFYSLFAVPYVAVPAELIDDRDLRARLITWRMFVVMLGILTGAGLVPWLATLSGGGRIGYASMSVGVAIACALAMTGPIVMLRGRDVARSSPLREQSARTRSALRRALRDRSFLQLGVAYLLQLSASGAVTSAVPYLVTRFFGRNDSEIGTALFVMLIATTVTVTSWGRLGRRHGELRMLQVAVVAYALTALTIGALALLQAPWSLALFGFALLGIPFGAMQVLPYTLVAALIHAGSAHNHSAEGISTGIWTATEKLGLALGPTITGLALWTTGSGGHPALPAITITASVLLMAGSIAALRSLHMLPAGSTGSEPAR
ncbi:MAG TPA: MFS transporter [Steroidobacteraceae bacterium]|nr:MFS transporter [Steroidobacteraceae bacterium]